MLIQNIKLGVFDVIPRGSLDSLTAEDLRLLLNGMGDISTQALIGYTSFNDESSMYTLDCFLSPLVFFIQVQDVGNWCWLSVLDIIQFILKNPSSTTDFLH